MALSGVYVPETAPPGMEYDFLSVDKGRVYGIYGRWPVANQKPGKPYPNVVSFEFGTDQEAYVFPTSDTTIGVEAEGYIRYNLAKATLAANTPLPPEQLGVYGSGTNELYISGALAKGLVNGKETTFVFDAITRVGTLATLTSGASKIVIETLTDGTFEATLSDSKGTAPPMKRTGPFEGIAPNEKQSSGSGSSGDYGALLGIGLGLLIIMAMK